MPNYAMLDPSGDVEDRRGEFNSLQHLLMELGLSPSSVGTGLVSKPELPPGAFLDSDLPDPNHLLNTAPQLSKDAGYFNLAEPKDLMQQYMARLKRFGD